jgi:hypothetical protein
MNMRSARRAVGAMAAVGALALSVASPVPVAAGPAVSCGPQWTTIPSSPVLKDPRAFAVLGEDDIWAVGSSRPDKGVVETGAEHWDGSAWTIASTPNPGAGENSYNGVAGVSSNDVWAVGYEQPTKKSSSAFRNFASHWDGVSWSSVFPPNASDESNSLAGVTALSSHNLWAVGYYFSDVGSARMTLAEHYNGKKWKIVPTPNPGGAFDSSLVGVSAVSAKDVWAAGYYNAGVEYRGLLEHWDGTSWTAVPAAKPPGAVEYVFTAISAASRRDVWAVGYQVVGTTHQGLVEHYDGTSWSVIPSADGKDGFVTVLRGVDGTFADAWAVGFQYDASEVQYRSYSEHWDGTSWTTVPMAIEGAPTKSEAYSVASVQGANQVWAGSRTSDLELYCSALRQPPRAPPPSPGRRAVGGGNTPVLGIPGVVTASPGPTRPAVAVVAEDVAEQAGIAQVSRTHGAVVADFNNDTCPDIFMGLHNVHPAKLYINDCNGHFGEIDQNLFVHRDRHGCTAADVNLDGLLDLFCNTGSDRGTEAKKNELWIQRPDHTFVYRAPQYGVMEPLDRGRLSTFIDINNDGYPDLFTTNFRDRADGMPSPNRVFINEGGTGYRMAPEYDLERNISGGSISVGDYDNDGYQDLLLDTQAGVKVFRNDQGNDFQDVTAAVGMAHGAQFDVFGDFNGDGKLDIAETNPHAVLIYLQAGGVFSKAFSVPVDSGLALATGDVNDDGALDIYVQEGETDQLTNAPDVVLLNDGDGKSFTEMDVPSTTKGVADAVTAIDYDDNGLTDFIVQNGGSDKEGPIQLIAFFPAPERHGP